MRIAELIFELLCELDDSISVTEVALVFFFFVAFVI